MLFTYHQKQNKNSFFDSPICVLQNVMQSFRNNLTTFFASPFNSPRIIQIDFKTAMGTAVAPNYANLFMDRFETKALANWPLKPLIWLRFIDDIFMIWTHGEDTLNEFITYLNGIHPTIKFTHELSNTHINFLDTTVKVNSHRELYTTLYEKPTDTHLYLHYTSSHHAPSKTKGPYG